MMKIIILNTIKNHLIRQKKEYNKNYDLDYDSDSSSEEESPINIAPTPESKDYSSIVCPCIGKIIQGGNLISTVLYVIGKSYWLVSYVAQADLHIH